MHIAILSQLCPSAIERLRSEHRCSVAINPPDAQKRRMLADADVAVLRSPVRLDHSDIDAAEQLRLVVRAGMGLESIDLEVAKTRGILVTCVPLSADSVAEHALGLMLCVARRIPLLHRSLQEGRWEKHTALGRELAGQRLGLLGFGRIGQRLGEIASGLGMSLLITDRSPGRPPKPEVAQRLRARFVSLDQLFGESDTISIQAPLTPQTRNLVGAGLLRLMRPDAILVNVGRGGIVDEGALFEVLSRGRIAGAASDVFTREPPGDHPLLRLPNFVGTPHVAAQTVEAQRRVGEEVVKIIEDFAHGRVVSEVLVP